MDRPEYTHNEQVLTYEMPRFFEDLHKKFAGKQVNVEEDGDLIYEGAVTDWVILQRIKYYPVRKGNALYIETQRDGSETKYSFNDPVLVWVVRDPSRQIVAVQAIDHDGRNIILRIRSQQATDD